MKKFINSVLSKLFGSLIEKAVEKKIEILNRLDSLIQGYRNEMVGHREYLENLTDQFSKNEEKLDGVIKTLTPEKIKKVLDPSLHEISEKELKIRTKFSGQDVCTFMVSKPCWSSGQADFFSSSPFDELKEQLSDGKTNRSSILVGKEIGNIPDFVAVIKKINCISKIESVNAMEFMLTKSGALTWDEVLPKIYEAISSLFEGVPQPETSNEVESVETSSEAEHV